MVGYSPWPDPAHVPSRGARAVSPGWSASVMPKPYPPRRRPPLAAPRSRVGPFCFDGGMRSSAAALDLEASPKERLEQLFEEIAELTGQRNAIDGRLVQIVAEIDGDGLCGMTGARSVASLVAWKAGVCTATAQTIATVAHRLAEFPRCAEGMREGRLSLDQVGVIAKAAADGSDEHYAHLAASATVAQLRTAVRLEPRPRPEPTPEPEPDAEPAPPPEPPRAFSKTSDEQ